jgi:OOP family OmpA-OmpF porin
MKMNKKLLCCALFGALGVAQTAAAQDYDDRWYATAGLGYGMFDNGRGVDDDFTGHLGFGRFVAPRWSLDAEIFYANPEKQIGDLNWSMYSLSGMARYHLRDEGDTWWPYFAVGVGAQRHEDEYSAGAGGPIDRKGNDLLAIAGAGLQADYGRTGVRAELGFRFDMDDTSFASTDDDYFSDAVASVSVIVKFGPEPSVASTTTTTTTTEVETVQKTCADLDDDGDGVNNCEDKCPNSTAGQAVGPDGCPVPVTIDLRGVNFDFDKSTLRPDAIAILDEAITILKKYPELKVEVAGHTDAIGTDAYNQKLSERRAQAVYDYLGQNGIDASRLSGPSGYGESRPIAPNTNPDGTDNPEGRAQNRRTELNVQN